MKRYFRIWKKLASCAIQSTLSNRLDSLGYLLGKLVRFGFFWLLIVSIFHHTTSIVGFSKYEVLLFYVTYNLMDVLPQIMFRGIYWFHNDVFYGNFDFTLIRPAKPLFYTMSRFVDLLDLLFLFPILGLFCYVIIKLSASLSFVNIFLYILFLIISLLIVAALHIIYAALIVRVLRAGDFIWFYRGAMSAGSFPPEVLPSLFRVFFTFVMPVVLIVAFPAKAMLGLLSFEWGLIGILYSILLFIFALWFWGKSLRFYSSASS